MYSEKSRFPLGAVIVVGAVLLFACVIVGTILFRRFGTTDTTANLVPTEVPGVTTPEVNLVSPDPIYGPSYSANSTLPSYICGADAFGSYFVLQQMQIAGIDVKHGFNLGIVPFFLDGNPAYDVSEEQRTALLDYGKWNCLLTTADSVALSSPGVITALVDESAGADQLWARDITTVNDLKGKRIAFARGSVGEYFVYYTLSIARLNPRFDVTLVPVDSVAEAVEAFNNGQADAVSGWEPDIYDAELTGGIPLLSSSQLRIITDVIVTSRQSLTISPDLVQSFHDAWFETLKAQTENFATSAGQIAAWGHNDWSFVYPESASDDLALWLENVAQADLGDNIFVMRDPAPLLLRLEIARRVWAASGATVPNDDVNALVNAGFVSRSASQPGLQANADPLNNTFSLTTKLDLSHMETQDAATLAVLPCRRFTFLPESTELTLESRRILDDCVVPTLVQSVGLFLQVNGSAAWPGPAGTYTQQEIQDFAEARAQSVVDYLVMQGIDPARFIVDVTLPPEDHWETEDPEIQAEDRYVEMTLITVGR
ncbi:MAG: ABC transporter substrate-binding protein [Anaerolineales bacterium]|nr:ABC transporter substrate-binding protein [Anaerolineales bacterium]